MKRVAILFAVMLAGCTTTPIDSPVTAIDVRDDMNKNLMFLKHANGLCFAVRYTSTHGGYIVSSFTNIPCVSGDTVFVR